MITIPLLGGEVLYKSHKKIGVGVTALGTSQAIALGAYTFALAQLDKR
jgi:glucokinase